MKQQVCIPCHHAEQLLSSGFDTCGVILTSKFQKSFNCDLSDTDESEPDLVTGVENNCNKCLEMASFLVDGVICLWRSYQGINIKLRMFHNQLKDLCCMFKLKG